MIRSELPGLEGNVRALHGDTSEAGSDLGGQFTSDDWQSFLKDRAIVCRMSRRGNRRENA